MAKGKSKGKGEKSDKETPGAAADGAAVGDAAEEAKKKKNKYRRDKPWDHDGIDHWKPVTITREDAPKGGLMLEESSFATLFPQYREQYLKQVWPDVRQVLNEYEIKAELNLVEGSMSVKTSRKTWDPYAIIKARDFMKLLARSVPLPQAQKIMEDETTADIMKISGFTRNKERLVKRRQRLVGPNGSTLKAIELLTDCFVMVQGQTVSIMGSIKGCKQVRKIVEDCMMNIHPIYHIKELMIRRELEKDPEMKDQSWERFLPQFKKRNVQRKKLKRKAKSKDIFPPQPTPRKEDLLMESGEYFLNEAERQKRKQTEMFQAQKAKSLERKKERAKVFVPPTEGKKRKAEEQQESAKDLAERLKDKAAAKKKKTQKGPKELLL